jgi:hypothetical protein
MPIINNSPSSNDEATIPDGYVRARTGEIISRDEAIYCPHETVYLTEDDYQDNYFTCDRCERVLNNDYYGSDGYCQDCEREIYDEFNEDEDEEEPQETAIRDDKKGEFIKSSRAFGVELELIDGDKGQLRDEIGGIYGLKHDGSISGDYAVEVVSPILQGKAGEDSIIKAVESIKKAGFRVNESCGFHTHLSADDFKCDTEFETINLFDLPKLKVQNKNPLELTIISKRLLKQVWRIFDGSRFSTNKQTIKKALDILAQRSFTEDTEIKGDKISTTVLNGVGNIYKLKTYLSKISADDTITNKILKSSIQDLKVEIYFTLSEKKEADYRKKLSEYNELSDKILRCNAECLSDKQLKTRGITRKEIIKYKEGKELPDYFLDSDDSIVIVRKYCYENFEKLKWLLATYHYFGELFSAMLPESRRVSNTYCKPIDTEFTFNEILEANTVIELEGVWYKERVKQRIDSRKSHHYDHSRYRSLNIHSLFEKGTVEIRQHSGTANIKKVLNWIVLHQTVLDNLANNYQIIKDKILSSYPNKARETSFEVRILQKYTDLITWFKIEPYLAEYIESRIKTFSGIDLKKVKRAKKKVSIREQDDD